MYIELDLETRKPSIFYREFGEGPPMIFLHGGWGYEMYPFDNQIREFHHNFRILIPDRSGYGRSSRGANFPRGFHQRGRQRDDRLSGCPRDRTVGVVGTQRRSGHGSLAGIESPERVSGIVMEAAHYDRQKPRSKVFFETAATNPDKFGEKAVSILAQEHGEDYWRKLLENHGQAWLDIHYGSKDPAQDLYGGRLSELSVPTILIHGSEDPRTEPGELDAIRALLPQATIHVIERGGHSPHSEHRAHEESNRIVGGFLAQQ